MVGSSPGSWTYFRTETLRGIAQRNVSGSLARASQTSALPGKLPTPQRRKRLILPGSGPHEDEVGVPPNLFPLIGVG